MRDYRAMQHYPSGLQTTYSLDYINSRPMVTAYEFPYCVKLAKDDPDRAIKSLENLANFMVSK